MVHGFGRWLTDRAQRVVPDPFVLALGLTVGVAGLGVGLTDHGPVAMLRAWHAGFWDLLAFGMQMALILVTGHLVAVSGPVRRAGSALARVPRSGAGAAAMVCAVTLCAALVNWGLGLVVGALLARDTALELSRRGVRAHYPLLGAAGYTGLGVWHGGLSGSAPLLVAQEGHAMVGLSGVIPVTETLGSAMNIGVTLALFATLPLLFWLLHPRDPAQVQGVEGWSVGTAATPARGEGFEGAPVVGWVVGGVGLLALGLHLSERGFAGVDLNAVIFGLLFLGVLLHGSLRSALDAAAEGVGSTTGVLLQFPFYAGIMGMMRDSGLVDVLSDGLVAVSTPATLPALSLLSAGLVNLVVPSGGGQWAVQGPILLEAARDAGVPARTAVMALAYGDQWTNLVQPFWALPLLGITGLKAGDIMGYGLIAACATGTVFCAGLLLG